MISMGHDRSPLISKLRMSLLDGKSRLSTALLKKVLKCSAKEEESDIILPPLTRDIFCPTVPFSEKKWFNIFPEVFIVKETF